MVANIIHYYNKIIEVYPKNSYTLSYEAIELLKISCDNEGHPIFRNEEEKNNYYDLIIMLVDAEVMDLPSDVKGTFKSFMPYTMITDKTTNQYNLQQDAITDDRGFRRIVVGDLSQPAYMVALGTYYSRGQVGDTFVVTLDNGNVFYCVTGDIKQDIHTDSLNQYRLEGTNIDNANIIEFIMDSDDDSYHDKLYTYGNVGWVPGYEDMSGAIVEIRKLDIPSIVQ